MIITIIFSSILILSILAVYLCNKNNVNFYMHECLGFLIAICIVVSSIVCAVCFTIIIAEHCAENKTIQENNIEYESLCKRLEIINSDYEDISKSDVIKDISEWNRKVFRYKYWFSNPWTSWFFSEKVVDALETIDYD